MEEKRVASKAPKKPSEVKLNPKDELSFAGEHPLTLRLDTSPFNLTDTGSRNERIGHLSHLLNIHPNSPRLRSRPLVIAVGTANGDQVSSKLTIMNPTNEVMCFKVSGRG